MAPFLPDNDSSSPPPPPYTKAPSSVPALFTQTDNDGMFNDDAVPLLSSPLTAHLRSLPARLNAARQARASAQLDRDLDTLPCLLSPIERFLHRVIGGVTVTARGSTVTTTTTAFFSSNTSAELTLVPAAAVPDGWVLSGVDQRRRDGEMVSVVRVRAPPGWKAGDGKTAGKGAAGQAGERRKDWAGDLFDDDADDEEGAGKKNRAVGKSARANDDAGGFDEWGRWEDGPDSSDDTAPLPPPRKGKGSRMSGGDDDDNNGRDGPLSVRSSWWWHDEDMARRLAGYLQPEQVAGSREAATDRAAGGMAGRRQGKQEKGPAARPSFKSWFGGGRSWGKKTASSGEEVRGGLGVGDRAAKTTAAAKMQQGDGAVSMTVRGEEVTFRRENKFGVWESLTGMGIVVTIIVRP